jgi:hypothetical protein
MSRRLRRDEKGKIPHGQAVLTCCKSFAGFDDGMRVLLKSEKSGLFLTQSGQWTEKAADAKSFLSGERAVAAARTLRLSETAVYFSYHDEGTPHLDFAVTPSFFDNPEAGWWLKVNLGDDGKHRG